MSGPYRDTGGFVPQKQDEPLPDAIGFGSHTLKRVKCNPPDSKPMWSWRSESSTASLSVWLYPDGWHAWAMARDGESELRLSAKGDTPHGALDLAMAKLGSVPGMAAALAALAMLLLLGCAEAHAIPAPDAAVLCPEPDPECFVFLTEEDREISWLPRTDCTQRPEREHYAMRPIWPVPEGSPCGDGGTCGRWGICEGGQT